MTDKEMQRVDFAKSSASNFEPVTIHQGKNVYISYNSVVGDSGFGYARDVDGSLVKIWHSGDVEICDDVEIRAFCTIDRATVKGFKTIIGAGSKLDHHCHIAHNVIIGKNNTFAAGCIIEGSCQIGDNNTFGTGVIVQKKLKVGSNCIIGSGSVITKDVPDNSVMIGNPGRLLRKNL